VVPRASRIIWWVQPHSLPRYPPGQDGLPGTEGAFLPCSFWLVQALASTGRVDEAAQLFTDLLELANPLGLLPEEINPKNHGYLGNYPQALTHAALIQAALAIRDAHPRNCPETRRKGTVMEPSGVPIEAVATESPALDEPALAADDIVQECGLGSFPASDPPSWWAAGSN
jgi:hypothetical protein